MPGVWWKPLQRFGGLRKLESVKGDLDVELDMF